MVTVGKLPADIALNPGDRLQLQRTLYAVEMIRGTSGLPVGEAHWKWNTYNF